MKKGFPNKILGVPIGWRNLGKVDTTFISTSETIEYEGHTLCKTRAGVGKEKSELFLYCPKCMVKLA